jgi:multiple sugar transport system ATP-binding protein
MTMADKIVVLRLGRVEQVGTPLDLYNEPENLFVAGFIGSPQMNFLDAAALGIAGAKTVGVRPEHLSVSTESGDWEGSVVHVEHLGADTNVYVDAGKAGTLTVRLFGEVHHAPGTKLFVSAEPRHIYRFDDAGQVIRG